MSAEDSIEHVVLLLLENRSFDQMLGSLQADIPKLDGIDPAQPPRANPDPHGGAIAQQPNALTQIQAPANVDFGHEPKNVDWQLGIQPPRQDPMSGFVDDFRSNNDNRDDDALAAQVMAYFAPDTLPVLHTLARNAVICDRWFSSVPGPTWPNRLFALTGTAAGWREMWSHPFSKPPLFFGQDTIFNRLSDKGLVGRVYTDNNALQSMLFILKRAPDSLRRSLDDFEKDTEPGKESTFPQFAFIEPRFFHFGGDPPNDQHPPHDVARGEALIARVYNALLKNPTLFAKTLLIVAWDEHGGFYDHLVPPTDAVPPDGLSCDGFDFRRLGVRVPALLVSPWLAPDVCSTRFDHTSILRYLSDKFGLVPLGARAQSAASLGGVFDRALPAPRTDLPQLQPKPPAAPIEAAPNTLQIAQTQAADETRRQRSLATVATAQRDLMQMTSSEITRAPKNDAALIRDIASEADARTLRVLCVHGVGHGDAASTWRNQWRQAIADQVRAQPGGKDFITEVQFVEYDDIFEKDEYKITPALIARAVLELAGGLISGPNESPQRGLFDVLGKVEDRLRWTAGMVMQWIDKPDLRDELRKRVAEFVADCAPDVICAHSLGSLIAYDLFRRDVAAGQGAQYTNKYLITFGSQIAHPSVRRVFDGRIEPLHAPGDTPSSAGFAQWFHLFNENDVAFTRRLPLCDARTSNLETDFLGLTNGSGDILSHDGASYLAHPGAQPAWLAAVSPGTRAARALGVPEGTQSVADSAPAVVRTADPRRPRALIVGINQYRDSANNLAGCVNDAFLISSVLQENGFEADDIRLVLDERATRQGIAERLEWLVDNARDGDVRVFWYSGHGAMIPTYSAHATPAGLEESLVPWDFDWSLEHAFTDTDFRRYYSQLPYGVQFLAGFDCCHAGGLGRGGARVRGIDPPDDVRHRMLKWSAEDQMWVPRNWVPHGARPNRMFVRGARTSVLDPNLRTLGQANDIRFEALHPKSREGRTLRTQRNAARRDYGHFGPFLPLMLFACGENQTAAEYEHGAISYGAFSFVAAKTLREFAHGKAVDGATLKWLIDTTGSELDRLGYPQTPQMVGPDESKYTDKTPVAQVLKPAKPKPAQHKKRK